MWGRSYKQYCFLPYQQLCVSRLPMHIICKLLLLSYYSPICRAILHKTVHAYQTNQEGLQGVSAGGCYHRLLLWFWRLCGEAIRWTINWSWIGREGGTSALQAATGRQLPSVLWQLLSRLLDFSMSSCNRTSMHGGTARIDRRGFPETLKKVAIKDWGQHGVMPSGNLVATVWKDKKDVKMLFHDVWPMQFSDCGEKAEGWRQSHNTMSSCGSK